MEKKRLLYALAGLGGVAAWLLFILACTGWPAWSPDGGKLLFPYADPATSTSGVALYDRSSGAVTSVFNFEGNDSNNAIPYTQFTRDGKQAVVALEWDRDRPPEVFLIPIGGQGPVRHFALPESKEISLAPFPEVAGELFMGFEYIARLNLKTGAVETRKLATGKGIHLVPNGDRILYLNYGLERQGQEGEVMQVGELDRTTLEMKPMFEFSEDEEKKRDISDLDAYAFVPEPGGARVITAALAGGKAAVLVFGASGLENIVHPEMPAGCRLTSLAWSVDRKFLYADALCPSAEKSHRQIEFAEIPLQGGPVRMTPVAQLIASGSENEYDSFLRVSLSPDGRMLATSTGALPGKALRNNADRGLYLVDLTDPNRKVTRAGIPKIPE